MDFNEFDIHSWTLQTADVNDESKYVCEDSFAVTVAPSTGLKVPAICGQNAGQHSKFFIYRVRFQNCYTLIFANKISAAERAELKFGWRLSF